MTRKRLLSVITGVFNEEAIVEDVYLKIKNVFESKLSEYDYEHIFMDNCSADNTLAILKKIAKKDKRVKIVSYSKNFGPINSGFTGLKLTRGVAVIPYEGSMKDPADLIPQMIKLWEKGNELVYGVRKLTADNWLLGNLRKLYYRVVKNLSSEDLLLDFGSFAVIDKKIVDAIRDIDDYKPYVRGLVATVGFKRKSFIYERGARKSGKSKSSLGYLVDYSINGIISYSIVPIRIMTYIGLLLSSISFISAIVYLILKLFYWKVTVPGITGVIFLVLFFSGIQLFFLGIIGEYVGAVHSQVRKKPFVVIREKINF